jgi:hypothetical protein
MIHRTRLARPRVSAAATLLALLLLSACPAHAAGPARRPAPAADSGAVESAPGKLLVPPAPGSESSARPGSPPSATVAPEDTAGLSRRRKAREDFGRGLMLEEQHAYAAAIISYTNAAHGDAMLRGPAYRIGLLYASRQQYDPAARAFREELHRNPGDRAATMEYALALTELGQTKRPVRMLEELTRLAPGDAHAWRSLGFVYGRLQRYEDAERALRGAVGDLDSLPGGVSVRCQLSWRPIGQEHGHPDACDLTHRPVPSPQDEQFGLSSGAL